MLSLDPSVEEEVGKRDLASARGQELEPCEVNDLPVGWRPADHMEGVSSMAPAVHFAPMPTASVKAACHLGLEDLRISLSLVWRLTRMHLGVVLFLVLGTQCTPLTDLWAFVLVLLLPSEAGPLHCQLGLLSYCVLGLVNYLVCCLGYFFDFISKVSIDICYCDTGNFYCGLVVVLL